MENRQIIISLSELEKVVRNTLSKEGFEKLQIAKQDLEPRQNPTIHDYKIGSYKVGSDDSMYNRYSVAARGQGNVDEK